MYEFFDAYLYDRHRDPSEIYLEKYTKGLSVYNHFNPLVLKEILEGGLCTDMETAERFIETYDTDYFGAINSFLGGCFSNKPFELLFNSIADLFDTLQNCLPGYQFKDFISFKNYYADCRIYGTKKPQKSVWLDYLSNHIIGIVLPLKLPSPFFIDKLPLKHAEWNAANSPPIPFKNDKKEKIKGIIEAARIKNKDDNTKIFPYIPGKPKEILAKRFNRRERVEMQKVGTLGPSNPFTEMLTGDIKDDTFDRANECLSDKNFIECHEEILNTKKNTLKAGPSEQKSEPTTATEHRGSTRISSWKDVSFEIKTTTVMLVTATIKGEKFKTINPTNLKGCCRNNKPTERWSHFLTLLCRDPVQPMQMKRVNESLADYFSLTKDFPPCFSSNGCAAKLPLKRKVRLHLHGDRRRSNAGRDRFKPPKVDEIADDQDDMTAEMENETPEESTF